MAQQTIDITSEALESAYRVQVPSQAGFTQDLMASNTIIPIIDLTGGVAGAAANQKLQEAIAFGSQTEISQVGVGTTVIANTPGFYRLVGSVAISRANAAYYVNLTMDDGITTKIVWSAGVLDSTGSAQSSFTPIDLVFFVDTSITLSVFCSVNNYTSFVGSVRQIATSQGVLVQPSGFTPQ